MGILYFIYFLFFSNADLLKSLRNVNSKKASLKNKENVKIQYELYCSFLASKNIKLNFFKKKNGFKFLFNNNNIYFEHFFKIKLVSKQSYWFVFVYLIYTFFFNNNIQNILLAVLKKKVVLNKLLLSFMHFTLVISNFSVQTNIVFFLNFFKFTDFFYNRKHVFLSVFNQNKIYISFFKKLPVLNFISAAPTVASDLKKYNLKKENETAVVLNENINNFLLFSSYFNVNKKFFFLRANEIFNKSRYSRNRQTYRTGVFWCIWLTVLTVIGLYFYFYVFLIKFTYIWLFFFFFISSFFFYYFRSKIEKHFFF